MSKQRLARGARAKFFRDGTDLVSACDIPTSGAFVVRDLPPGQYVVKDSQGGEMTFSRGVMDEVTTLIDGDFIGTTGAPGISGSSETATQRVGVGGGVFTHPDQVAPGENVSKPIRREPGEMPAEKAARVPDVALVRDRPKDPTVEERVPGAAGAAFVQEVPIRSADEVGEEAARRGTLSEDDRMMEQLEAEETGGQEVPVAVAPDPVGPEPLESTVPPEGYGASSPKTPTPLDGRRVGDAQPVLGAEPEAA